MHFVGRNQREEQLDCISNSAVHLETVVCDPPNNVFVNGESVNSVANFGQAFFQRSRTSINSFYFKLYLLMFVF